MVHVQVLFAYVWLFLVNWPPGGFADLPRWVHRVDSCPEVGNVSQWIKASKELNCDDLMSEKPEEQRRQYHCLISSFINETLEFCGINAPVVAGKCPVYNYEFHQNESPASYNCSQFTSGCPNKTTYSKNVYKYPDCLSINKKEKCFKAESNCGKNPTNERSTTERTLIKSEMPISESSDSNGRSTTERTLIKSEMPISESSDSKKLRNSVYALIILVVCVCILLLISICKRYGCYAFFRKFSVPNRYDISRICRRFKKDEYPLQQIHHGNCLPSNGVNTYPPQKRKNATKVEGNVNGHVSENDSDFISSIDKAWQTAKTSKTNELKEDLTSAMTEETLNDIKKFLQDSTASGEVPNISDQKELLKYLDEQYGLFHNLVFVQGLFLKFKANRLYDICVAHAKARENEEIIFFEKTIPREDYSRVTYHVKFPNPSAFAYKDEKKLIQTLAWLTGAEFKDILVDGIREGSIIVSLLISNCVITTLKSLYNPENLSKTCLKMAQHFNYEIIKVVIQEDVFDMPDISTLPEDDSTASPDMCGSNCQTSHQMSQEMSNEDDTMTNSNDEDKRSHIHRLSTCLCEDCVREYKMLYQLDCDS